MTILRALEIALTLIDLFNGNHSEDWERLSVENVLERMRFKELKTFSFKNLRRFHEMNLERKIPNNFPITPENTLKAQEINFYLEYLEDHTIYIPEDWGKRKGREISYEDAKQVCEKYQAVEQQKDDYSQYSLTQLKALVTGNLEILKPGQW